MYIGDSNNNRVRKVTVSTGIITTVAGTGTGSYSGDNGQATSAGIYSPEGVSLDSAGTHSTAILLFNISLLLLLLFPQGNIYIADELNNCIRKVTISPATSTPR